MRAGRTRGRTSALPLVAVCTRCGEDREEDPITDGPVNERLADLAREAGLSHKALARAVREVSARQGEAIGCDHTSVSRWLRGMQPRGRTPQFIAEALGRKLGRRITTADVGMSGGADFDPAAGLDYGDNPDAAVAVLTRLWRADLDDVSRLVDAPTSAAAWVDAALSWLVRAEPGELADRAAGGRVGASDIEAVRVTTLTFAQLDNRFGGGHARRALIHYLGTDVGALLAGRYTDATGRQLHAAVSEATLLAAWSSYDAGHHGLAQRYFIQALRLAHAADDVLLAGSILDAMSHQATFLGRWREAANLARAARNGTGCRATATLTAHFHAMEARALAAGQDAAGMHRSLGEAVRVFERRGSTADPEWISYFDDVELSAEFGHCFRDIGRAADAVTYATHALAGAGQSARSDFFVTMVLADGQLGSGEVEEACSTARSALEIGTLVKSARCAEYVRGFRRRLAPHAGHSAVRELAEHGAGHALWTTSTAARPSTPSR